MDVFRNAEWPVIVNDVFNVWYILQQAVSVYLVHKQGLV